MSWPAAARCSETKRVDEVPRLFESRAVPIPGPCDCRLGVMKDIQITRQTAGVQRDAQRYAAGNVAFAQATAVGG